LGATIDYVDAPTNLCLDWLNKINYDPPEVAKLKELFPTQYHSYLNVFSKEKGQVTSLAPGAQL